MIGCSRFAKIITDSYSSSLPLSYSRASNARKISTFYEQILTQLHLLWHHSCLGKYHFNRLKVCANHFRHVNFLNSPKKASMPKTIIKKLLTFVSAPSQIILSILVLNTRQDPNEYTENQLLQCVEAYFNLNHAIAMENDYV